MIPRPWILVLSLPEQPRIRRRRPTHDCQREPRSGEGNSWGGSGADFRNKIRNQAIKENLQEASWDHIISHAFRMSCLHRTSTATGKSASSSAKSCLEERVWRWTTSFLIWYTSVHSAGITESAEAKCISTYLALFLEYMKYFGIFLMSLFHQKVFYHLLALVVTKRQSYEMA